MFKLIRHSMQELMSLSQRKRKENCIQSNSNRITIDHISQFNQNLTSFKIVICRWSGEPKKSNKKIVKTCANGAVHRIYAPLSKTHRHAHSRAQCAHKTHMWPSNNNNSIIRRIEFAAACVCVCVSCIYLSTRVILGMKLSSILLINGMTVLRPHERKSYDWWTRGAHMLTHSFSLSLSLALSHWHLINILT